MNKTKNRKQQIIPLSNTLSITLKEYLRYRGGTVEDYLFCSQVGNQMTRDSLVHSIHKYNKKRGVTKTSIHLFRHTFAKNWILNGGDIFRLQKILGHSTLDMVREYVNLYGNDLQHNFNEYNPLEKFSNHNKHISMR